MAAAEDIAFLARFGIPHNLLGMASDLARARGTVDRDELFGLGFDAIRYWSLLAEHLGLPFRPSLAGTTPDPSLPLPANDAVRRASVAMVSLDGRTLVAIAPEPTAIARLETRLKAAPELAERFVVVPDTEIRRHLADRCETMLADQAIGTLAADMPALSARDVTRLQSRWPVLLCAFGFAIIPAAPKAALMSMGAVASMFFLNCIAWKFAAAVRPTFRARSEAVPTAALPSYSILVPLYREASVLLDLVEHLARLDYPARKRQVLLVLEADDTETRAAAGSIVLPPGFQTVIVPPCEPRTKPKALMYALPFATGDFVVVYDAEDRPEPDQLRRAAARFRERPGLGCVQAALEPDNEGSLVAKLFGLEYAANFDVVLPSLAAWGLPLPLGGTSNHFPRDVLEKTGGWDPYNVTEDADLGIRLARFGYACETLTSRTFEEAPVTLRQWFPQRRRWIKGWMQTVLLCAPGRLPRSLRLPPIHSLAVHGILTGGVLGLLLYPLSLVSVAFLGHSLAVGTFPAIGMTPLLLAFNATSLVAIVVASTIASLRGLYRTDRLRHAWLVVLLPFYWALMSVAAWQALASLIRRPSHWEKTRHGVATDRNANRTRGQA